MNEEMNQASSHSSLSIFGQSLLSLLPPSPPPHPLPHCILSTTFLHTPPMIIHNLRDLLLIKGSVLDLVDLRVESSRLLILQSLCHYGMLPSHGMLMVVWHLMIDLFLFRWPTLLIGNILSKYIKLFLK